MHLKATFWDTVTHVPQADEVDLCDTCWDTVLEEEELRPHRESPSPRTDARLRKRSSRVVKVLKRKPSMERLPSLERIPLLEKRIPSKHKTYPMKRKPPMKRNSRKNRQLRQAYRDKVTLEEREAAEREECREIQLAFLMEYERGYDRNKKKSDYASYKQFIKRIFDDL